MVLQALPSVANRVLEYGLRVAGPNGPSSCSIHDSTTFALLTLHTFVQGGYALPG
ncbi:hypothetical protein [Streptomyces sp. Inha503]|uniref:hypothetical protein n=1 Tax=Streptomyces sp. Inha503 TaxID=3383314 RepID=UPI0039A0A774